MKILGVAFILLITYWSSKKPAETIAGAKGEVFVKRVVADRLSDPWEITYGPDAFLWVTESKGYRVIKINPATGARSVLLDLNNAKNFSRYDQEKNENGEGKPWPQGGLMGLALHPQFLDGKPYVYLSYVYNFAGADAAGKGCAENFGGCFFTTRIVRYTYDVKEDTLIAPQILCDTIPGSSDHNGGRLLVALAAGTTYLFYAVGEMGAGQFDNAGRPNHAQNINYYEGKILRFNTEPDADTTGFDKWVPDDNPFNAERQNAVWTLGHRNPQGLASFMGRIYAAEHGPFSDDEINLIEGGKNYGHPLIEGYADGNYNGLAAGASEHKELPGVWHTSYPAIVNEQKNAATIGTAYRNPMKSFYPTPKTTLQHILSKRRNGENVKWISEAPSSIDVYTATAIPGWKNSLLMPTLKTGQLLRLQLNARGDGITGDTMVYFKDVARYRDVALAPEGNRIYLAIDSAAQSSGPTEDNKKESSCRGCIVEFTYTGTGTGATKK